MNTNKQLFLRVSSLLFLCISSICIGMQPQQPKTKDEIQQEVNEKDDESLKAELVASLLKAQEHREDLTAEQRKKAEAEARAQELAKEIQILRKERAITVSGIENYNTQPIPEDVAQAQAAYYKAKGDLTANQMSWGHHAEKFGLQVVYPALAEQAKFLLTELRTEKVGYKSTAEQQKEKLDKIITKCKKNELKIGKLDLKAKQIMEQQTSIDLNAKEISTELQNIGLLISNYVHLCGNADEGDEECLEFEKELFAQYKEDLKDAIKRRKELRKRIQEREKQKEKRKREKQEE